TYWRSLQAAPPPAGAPLAEPLSGSRPHCGPDLLPALRRIPTLQGQQDLRGTPTARTSAPRCPGTGARSTPAPGTSPQDRSTTMRRRRFRLPLLAAGALLAPFLAVALPTAAHAASATATFAKDQDWGTGYGGSYTINNGTTSTINGWTLEFDLPANNSVASLWNATYTTAAPHVTVKHPSWQATIAPGASYHFGFNTAY